MTRWRWTPPPEWPAPPAGWRPFPGWQPDPSWPAPPVDWQFWQPRKRTVWKRVGLGAAIGVAGLFGAALIGAEVTDSIRGCGSVDPTDPGNYSTIHIVNDTSQPVVVDDCDGDECDPDQLPQSLLPGQIFSDHAACGETGSDMTSWQLTGPDGAVLGFIAVASPRSGEELSFAVTHSSPDRHTATPSG